MRNRRLRQLGLALVLAGAIVLAGPTLGFDVLNVDRGVSVETASNPNAQLGLQEDYGGEEIAYQPGGLLDPPQVDDQVVGNVTNNLENSATVSVSVESIQWEGGSDAVLEVSNSDAFLDPMGPGTTRPIELGCSQAIGGTSEGATVVLEVDATGGPISVQDATHTIEGVAFSCEGANGDQPPDDPIPINDSRVGLTVSGAPSADGVFNSEVTVPIRNTETDSVSITGIHLADSSSGTRVQRLVGSTVVQITGSEQVGTLDAQNGLEIGSDAPQYDLGQNAVIAGEDNAAVAIWDFRGSDSFLGTADMSGESVTVVLMVEGLDVDGRSDPVPVKAELEIP